MKNLGVILIVFWLVSLLSLIFNQTLKENQTVLGNAKDSMTHHLIGKLMDGHVTHIARTPEGRIIYTQYPAQLRQTFSEVPPYEKVTECLRVYYVLMTLETGVVSPREGPTLHYFCLTYDSEKYNFD